MNQLARTTIIVYGQVKERENDIVCTRQFQMLNHSTGYN